MRTKKKWYKSETIRGIIVAVLGLAVQVTGVEISTEEITTAVSTAMQGVGLLWALIGRIIAKEEVTL